MQTITKLKPINKIMRIIAHLKATYEDTLKEQEAYL